MVDIHLAEWGCVTGMVVFGWQLHYISLVVTALLPSWQRQCGKCFRKSAKSWLFQLSCDFVSHLIVPVNKLSLLNLVRG